jgi:ABC-type sugar transport system substrate-binding protein
MRVLKTLFAAAVVAGAMITAAVAKDYTVGVTIGDMGHPFHIRVWKTLQERAADLGIKLIILDDKRDLATEASNVDTLLSRGVDGLMVMAVNPKGSVPACKRAQAAGIPVLTIVDQAEGIPYVGSDLVDGAGMSLVADYMVKKLGGKGNLVYIKGAAAVAVERLRDEGFKNVIKNYPGIKIIFEQNGEWNRDSGARLMSDALVQLPNKSDITAVVTHDDAMTLGALEIAKNQGRAKDMEFYGNGGQGQFLEAIKNGEATMTVFQNGELIAVRAIEEMYKALHGKPLEKVVSVDWTPITKDNVQSFIDRFDANDGRYRVPPEYKEKM